MAFKKAVSFGPVAANPAITGVSNEGTPGATSYTYKIVALLTDGTRSAASSASVTANGAATLNGTDFNRITWTDPAVAHGAVIDKIEIYRTASAGTPSSVGKIGQVNAGVETFDDTGLAGDAAVPPSTNGTGIGDGMSTSNMKNASFHLNGVGSATFQVQVSYDNGTSWVNEGAALTADGSEALPDAAQQCRVNISAYVSGSAAAGVYGESI